MGRKAYGLESIVRGYQLEKLGDPRSVLTAYIPNRLQYTVARKVRPGHSGNDRQLIQQRGCTSPRVGVSDRAFFGRPGVWGLEEGKW